MPIQAQYSTSEQLAEVKRLAELTYDLTCLKFSDGAQIYCMANRQGLYDAADLIKERMKIRTQEVSDGAGNLIGEVDLTGLLDWK